MRTIIEKIVQNNQLHAKWLNTLSFMENCGARKISAGEDRIKTSLMQLKHAAEEHRHAYYLKKQMGKLAVKGMAYYELDSMLGGWSAQHYLHKLDVFVCRYLKQSLQLSPSEIPFGAYLLVTYAIEVRADELYPVYQEILTRYQSPIVVKSIILEEEGHLEEMIAQLRDFATDWENHAAVILAFENKLFNRWMERLRLEITHADPAGQLA